MKTLSKIVIVAVAVGLSAYMAIEKFAPEKADKLAQKFEKVNLLPEANAADGGDIATSNVFGIVVCNSTSTTSLVPIPNGWICLQSKFKVISGTTAVVQAQIGVQTGIITNNQSGFLPITFTPSESWHYVDQPPTASISNSSDRINAYAYPFTNFVATVSTNAYWLKIRR